MSDYEFIKVKKENKICTITLDHAPVNSISQGMLADLAKACDDLTNDKETRAVILTGAGTHAFCAGADLKEFESVNPQTAGELVKNGQDTFQKIADLPQPVIAAINGLTLGGGCEMSMACDIRVASDRARFGQPEVWIGLIPAWGGTQRMTRLLGAAKAKELILTGQMINAQEAYRIGLVNKVVPDGEEVRAAIDIARMIIAKSAPLAVTAAKKAINDGLDAPTLADGFKVELEAAASVATSEDLVEGITAFIEKRQPDFQGK